MTRPGGWRIALWAAIVVAALTFLYLVRGVLLPFLLAFAISAILAPLITKLQKRGWPKGLAIGSIFALFFGALIALGIWLTPIVSTQVVGFKERVEDVASDFAQPNEDTNYFVRWNPVVVQRATSSRDVLDTFLEGQASTLERLGLPSSKRAIYAQYIEPQRGQINKSLQNFLQGFVGIASGFVSQVLILLFVPLLVLLILPNWENLRRKIFALIPPQIRPTTVALLEDIGDVFSRYLRGVAIAVSGYMAFMAILLTALGAPYGVLLGVLFGMVYLIPYLNVIIASSVLFGVTMLSGQNARAVPAHGIARRVCARHRRRLRGVPPGVRQHRLSAVGGPWRRPGSDRLYVRHLLGRSALRTSRDDPRVPICGFGEGRLRAPVRRDEPSGVVARAACSAGAASRFG